MKMWAWPWARGAVRNFGVPYNISATAEANDFKFGTLIGFAKRHYKVAHRAKSGRDLRLRKRPNICGSPLIFLQWLKLATPKLACGWGLPRPEAHHKIPHRRKSGRGPGVPF